MSITTTQRPVAPVLDEPWMHPGPLNEIRDRQLNRVLGWAGKSPFYRNRDGFGKRIPTVRDFDRIEPTSKQDLRDAYPYGFLAVPNAELKTYHESSGTAGRATASYYTESDWVDLAERFARKWIPITPDDSFLVRTPYAMLLTGHLAHAAAEMKRATIIPGDNRSLAVPFSRVVRVLRDLKVTLSWSVPSEPLLWAAAAAELGMDPQRDFPALRAFYVGGEPMSDARRARISEIWGVPVVEEYGATEVGSIAGECPAGHLHLWSDRILGEIYDPRTGDITSEGRGQLLVTPLYRRAMPLLRYNLEDTVVLSHEPCQCGWAYPRLTVDGRTSFAHSVEGLIIQPRELEEIVFSLPMELGVMFWRARALPDQLHLQIEVAPHNAATAKKMLVEAVHHRFGVTATVEQLAVGSLVPTEVLTGSQDVVKPRSLFGPDEDWSKAILYY